MATPNQTGEKVRIVRKDGLSGFLRERMKAEGFERESDFARHLGISRQRLNYLLNGCTVPRPSMLAKVGLELVYLDTGKVGRKK